MAGAAAQPAVIKIYPFIHHCHGPQIGFPAMSGPGHFIINTDGMFAAQPLAGIVAAVLPAPGAYADRRGKGAVMTAYTVFRGGVEFAAGPLGHIF